MKRLLPSTTVLAYGAMALPGTLVPREAGMSLYNRYWTLGWPVPQEVTVYGPSSGYSGMSMPFLPDLACSFALWFGLAALSHWMWLRAHSGPATLARALSAGVICALWGVILTCFVVGAGRFVMEWRWASLDEQHLYRSMTTLARIYPALCVGFLCTPFVSQFIVSGRYPFWPRVAFCSVPLLLFAGLSCPYAERMYGVLPIVRPVAQCQGYYAHLLEQRHGILGAPPPQRRPGKATKPEGQPDGSANGIQPIRSATDRTSSAAGSSR